MAGRRSTCHHTIANMSYVNCRNSATGQFTSGIVVSGLTARRLNEAGQDFVIYSGGQ